MLRHVELFLNFPLFQFPRCGRVVVYIKLSTFTVTPSDRIAVSVNWRVSRSDDLRDRSVIDLMTLELIVCKTKGTEKMEDKEKGQQYPRPIFRLEKNEWGKVIHTEKVNHASNRLSAMDIVAAQKRNEAFQNRGVEAYMEPHQVRRKRKADEDDDYLLRNIRDYESSSEVSSGGLSDGSKEWVRVKQRERKDNLKRKLEDMKVKREAALAQQKNGKTGNLSIEKRCKLDEDHYAVKVEGLESSDSDEDPGGWIDVDITKPKAAAKEQNDGKDKPKYLVSRRRFSPQKPEPVPMESASQPMDTNSSTDTDKITPFEITQRECMKLVNNMSGSKPIQVGWNKPDPEFKHSNSSVQKTVTASTAGSKPTTSAELTLQDNKRRAEIMLKARNRREIQREKEINEMKRKHYRGRGRHGGLARGRFPNPFYLNKPPMNAVASTSTSFIPMSTSENESGQQHPNMPNQQPIDGDNGGRRFSEHVISIRYDPLKSFKQQWSELEAKVLTMSKENAGRVIARSLRERNRSLICRSVDIVGIEKVFDLYKKTQKINRNGGLLIKTGTRRRTRGGVLLYLLRNDLSITESQKEELFREQQLIWQMKLKEIKTKKLQDVKNKYNLDQLQFEVYLRQTHGKDENFTPDAPEKQFRVEDLDWIDEEEFTAPVEEEFTTRQMDAECDLRKVIEYCDMVLGQGQLSDDDADDDNGMDYDYVDTEPGVTIANDEDDIIPGQTGVPQRQHTLSSSSDEDD